MRPSSLSAAGLLVPVLLALAAPAAAQGGRADTLRTRAERSAYRETTRYDEVVRFVEAVDRASPLVHLATMGYTMEGRPLPLAVVGRVADASPAAVRASGRTRVYVQGNIHAGEVEGKEATLELLRALAGGAHPRWADSLVLLVAPIYNADGNERVRMDNRPHQLGPVAGMGQRPNAQGLDLNRDHLKLDSPEARSLAAMLREYDPHVLIDLHTTNGTFHAYHLTYAPPLHPNTDSAIVRTLREEWLPDVTRGMKRRGGFDLYHYGNVPQRESTWAAPQGSERGWYTFDHRPRFGTNYAGLRNRFAILSEAYAYLTFERRIEVTRRFVEESLDWAAAHATAIRRATLAADRASVVGRTLALRARPERSARPVRILMGEVEELRHPYTGETMLRRKEVSRPEMMPEYISFAPTETERAPRAYLVPAALGAVRDRLEAHGVRFTVLERATRVRAEEFAIDSTWQAPQPFQGHRERTVTGRWGPAEREVPAGTLVVPVDQPLGRLVFSLLEPRSDEGLLSWGLMDEALAGTKTAPVLRAHEAVR